MCYSTHFKCILIDWNTSPALSLDIFTLPSKSLLSVLSIPHQDLSLSCLGHADHHIPVQHVHAPCLEPAPAFWDRQADCERVMILRADQAGEPELLLGTAENDCWPPAWRHLACGSGEHPHREWGRSYHRRVPRWHEHNSHNWGIWRNRAAARLWTAAAECSDIPCARACAHMCRDSNSAIPELPLSAIASKALAAIDKLSKMTPGFHGKCLLKLAAIRVLWVQMEHSSPSQSTRKVSV